MKLCRYCIEELQSRGEDIVVGGIICEMEEAEEEGAVCDLCEEYDDLYICNIR